MNARYLLLMFAMAIAAGLPSVANATLADDSSARTAGSISINWTTDPKFFAHIDYAVYAPGNYSGSLSFPADQYVYCYQLFNDSTSMSKITSLYINIAPNAIVDNTNYDNASFSGETAGINPTSYAYNSYSEQVQYGFNSRNLITVNQHSSVLIFTSEFAPDSIMGTGTLGTTTAGSFSVQLPVPTPEPVSLLLMTMATPALLRIRGRNRKQ
jgi:hypothetical protein